ncbi:Hsp20 family protein [Halosegnis rubeus]|jgi:HSP20 family molecular chaperone IbpA|uniref:Hsp20 family protein n=1 Tax=Halosegnis rubeus TaxID=2212850 RepID=A0A5N5U4N7_9EURY|nr:Hsp20 family protein [Halosegnis rubeus]KAB7513419.1 Hsp20 family protein [Halosegnis rubeus]
MSDRPDIDIQEMGESLGKELLSRAGQVSSRVQEERPLVADVLESDDAYLVVFDAAGIEIEDVQVRFEDGGVEVRLDRFRDASEEFEMVFPGRGLTLEGRAELPGGDVNPEAAEATLTAAGTLHVEVPKVATENDETDEHADSEE